MALVDATTLILGTPTVLGGAHPAVAYAAFLANALRPNLRFVSIVNSYGWGGKTLEQICGMLTNLKAEILPPVQVKGCPREVDFKAVDDLAETVRQKHRQIGITEN